MTSFLRLFSSLKARIMVSALIMTFVLLPVVGFTIVNAYEQHMKSGLKNELKAYSYSILAVAEVTEQTLNMPEVLLENQLNVSQSGLYAFFSESDVSASPNNPKVLWRSGSLLGLDTPNVLKTPDVGAVNFSVQSFNQAPHFMFSFTVAFETENASYPVTLHVLKNTQVSDTLLVKFEQKLWSVLVILIIFFVSFQLIWLVWTLKPLNYLKAELAEIEQGGADKLSKAYPNELAQVTQQLNQLLSAEQLQRKRYRNALSDLAHSLKTPLAVIKNQPDLSSEVHQQLDNMNNMVEHQLKRAQTAGHAAWHLGTNVKRCIDKLLPSLEKIYCDKSLTFTQKVSADAVFKGDEADLFEILGNILDNACKAAQHKIHLSVSLDTKQGLLIEIEDDGKGISGAEKEIILLRGTRADTYEKGHGIGLAIVRDLVTSYQGSIEISPSKALGGANFTLRF